MEAIKNLAGGTAIEGRPLTPSAQSGERGFSLGWLLQVGVQPSSKHNQGPRTSVESAGPLSGWTSGKGRQPKEHTLALPLLMDHHTVPAESQLRLAAPVSRAGWQQKFIDSQSDSWYYGAAPEESP